MPARIAPYLGQISVEMGDFQRLQSPHLEMGPGFSIRLPQKWLKSII
jgi:hypothetical protein